MAQVVATRVYGCAFAAAGSLSDKLLKPSSGFAAKSMRRIGRNAAVHVGLPPIKAVKSPENVIPVTPEDVPQIAGQNQYVEGIPQLGDMSVGMWSKPTVTRKTKIVCTIGPSTNTKEMIWKLAEAGMNVARLNMSHGDHSSHQKVIDLVLRNIMPKLRIMLLPSCLLPSA